MFVTKANKNNLHQGCEILSGMGGSAAEIKNQTFLFVTKYKGIFDILKNCWMSQQKCWVSQAVANML